LRTTLSIVATVLLLQGCATAPPPDASAGVHALTEQFFEERLPLNPLQATEYGDFRFNDRFTLDLRGEDRAARRALYERYVAAFEAVDPSTLNEQSRLTREVVLQNTQYELEALRFPGHLLPVHQFGSMPAYFAELGSGAGIHPFRTVKDYDDFLRRMDGFVIWTDAAIANMREGVSTGIVQPRIVIEKALPQFEEIARQPVDESIFFTPIRNMPASFSEADRTRLTGAYRAAISGKITPTYARLAKFLRDEYLPVTRESVSLAALPSGEAWYRSLVRRHTTTTLSPEEIHVIGLREVARIQGEMNAVMRRVRFEGDLRQFFEAVRQDPTLKFSSREEIVETYRQIKNRVDPQLPRLFDVFPQADYQVRPVEPFQEASAAGGSYQPATPDGSRPGVFWVNTYNAAQRMKTGAEALSLHEGNPGHHFQITIQREQTRLPRMQRFDWNTAYVEGWGLYAESLGPELGLFTDPYQDFGRLSSELWRSIRLVLDTGLHAKGWTRQQAIDYALANSGTTPFGAESEVNRFIAIPGQALAYKIGELEIQALKAKAQQELGPRFDVREFHREILIDGSLPLETLRAKMERWIDRKRS
jgi:uncharacterized protein (DUF885 family)